MAHPEQDELQVLRERAYGPAADIHLDSQALQRLHELEGRGGGWEQAPAAETGAADETHLESPPPSPVDEPALTVGEGDARPAEPRLAAFRMRRSTGLIVLALVAVIVASYAALVLVQRVQTAPLQADASQVERLSEDPAYEIPAIFGTSGQPGGARAYQDFYGLRAIVNDYGAEGNDICILIFPSESATDADGNFTGPGYSGCAAGAFPAAVAFIVTSELPEELRNAFPEGTALQFAFDGGNNEVVVFSDR